jgi:hypothetical protein
MKNSMVFRLVFSSTALLVFLFVFVGAKNAFASFNGHPRCKEMSAEIWKKNSDRCFGVFKDAPQPHKIADESAKKLCDCVADELVNEMSCSNMKKYDTNKEFEKKTETRITQACMKKFNLKPKD